jgi:orotate phosphoribosyltransferase
MDNILELLRSYDAFLEGHFILSSGLHSRYYIQCAQVLQHPKVANKLANYAKELFLSHCKNVYPTVIVSPALGGIIWGYELARAFSQNNNTATNDDDEAVRAIFAERDPDTGNMTLRRNFAIYPTDKVIIAEDVITTGLSTNEVINIVKNFTEEILSIICIVDRSSGVKLKLDADVPIISLAKISIENYTQEDCPLCKQNIPLVKPGSRRRT